MENSKFEIVKNVPIPATGRNANQGRSAIYPFKEMEIGDCLKFEATGVRDAVYRRIYGSAKSHTRRNDCPYEFKFAKIDEGVFGCWKVEKGYRPAGSRRRRRSKDEIESISFETLKEALEMDGSVAGAARRVGISPRTFIRLMESKSSQTS